MGLTVPSISNNNPPSGPRAGVTKKTDEGTASPLTTLIKAEQLEKQKFILQIQASRVFNYVPEKWRKDPDVILAAVKQDGYNLKYAALELKKNKVIVLAAAKQDSCVFEYAAPELKKDREFILAAVKQNGYALEFADPELKKDKEVVWAAFKQNKYALQFADNSLKKDKKFILAAVKQDGYSALKFADPELKKDKEVVLAAFKQNVHALEFDDSGLKKDKKFILAAVKQNGYILRFADPELKKDGEFILSVVKQNISALRFAAPELMKNREFFLAAVKQDSYVLEFADPELKKDREFILAAVKQNGLALQYAAWELENDQEINICAVKQNWKAYEFIRNKKDFKSSFLSREGESAEESLQIIENLIYPDKLDFFERFNQLNTPQMKEIIANRKNFQPDNRPLALVVYPKTDWNGAFKNNQIKDLMDHGYQVIYFEAKKDLDFYRALEKFGQKQKISLLVVGGHGAQEVLAFGAGDPAKSELANEEFYMDFSDQEEMTQKNLAQYLEDDAVIILESCSTGGGKQWQWNIANLFKNIFIGRTVFAPVIPAGVSNYEFDSNNKITNINYSSGNNSIYKAMMMKR